MNGIFKKKEELTEVEQTERTEKAKKVGKIALGALAGLAAAAVGYFVGKSKSDDTWADENYDQLDEIEVPEIGDGMDDVVDDVQ